MAELKSFSSCRIYRAVDQVESKAGDIDNLYLDDNLFYIKSEADAYIADLEERHKEEVDELQKSTDSAWGKVNAMYDEILHQKRKRCLAMAYTEWLKQILLCSHPHGINFQRALQRQKKWLSLADKFKD